MCAEIFAGIITLTCQSGQRGDLNESGQKYPVGVKWQGDLKLYEPTTRKMNQRFFHIFEWNWLLMIMITEYVQFVFWAACSLGIYMCVNKYKVNNLQLIKFYLLARTFVVDSFHCTTCRTWHMHDRYGVMFLTSIQINQWLVFIAYPMLPPGGPVVPQVAK